MIYTGAHDIFYWLQCYRVSSNLFGFCALSVVTETVTSTTRLTSLPPSECLLPAATHALIIGRIPKHDTIITVGFSVGCGPVSNRVSLFCCVSSRCYRGNQRIKSQEYVHQCWWAELGEECLNPEQQHNVFHLMWEKLFKAGDKSVKFGSVSRLGLGCWTVLVSAVV